MQELRIVALLACTSLASGQGPQPSAQPQFEVASVKLQPFTGHGRVGISVRGNTLDAEHVSLTAPYDFTLQFIVENGRAGQETGGSDLPTLAAPVQEQLGLKLERDTALFDTVVIDHVERPSGN